MIDSVAEISSRDEEIKKLANKLKTPREIFNYAHRQIRYYPDEPGHQLIRAAWRSLKDRKGNCVDYTVLISALLRVNGISHALRTVATAGSNYDHIYIVTADGVVLDPVLGQRQDGSELTGQRSKPRYNDEVHYTKKMDYPVKISQQLGAIETGLKATTPAGRALVKFLNENTQAVMRCDDVYKNRGDGGIIGRAIELGNQKIKTLEEVLDFLRIASQYISHVNVKPGLFCRWKKGFSRDWEARAALNDARQRWLKKIARKNGIDLENGAYEQCLKSHSAAVCRAAFGPGKEPEKKKTEPIKKKTKIAAMPLLAGILLAGVAINSLRNETN